MLKLENIRIEHLKDYAVTDNEKPRFTLTASSDAQDAFASGYRIVVSDNGTIVWDTGRVNSDITANIVYAGAALKPFTCYKVEAFIYDNDENQASKTAVLETGRLGTAWDARWVTHPDYEQGKKGNPVPFVFKRECELKGEIKSARIYCTAMGVYTLRLNGARVGMDYLAPGYTSYNYNLYYQVYDVTDMLGQANTLLCTVAGGWACGEFGPVKQNKTYADKPALLCELRVEYADGTGEIIASGCDWLVTTDGPVRDASIYDGEKYDARMDIANAAFVYAAAASLRVKPVIRAESGVLPRPVKRLEPVSSHRGKDGIIYDFGQNFAGVVSIRLNARAGQLITVRHAEVLIDGELFTRPLRTAKATVEYICRDGEQEYCPEYTYMGFRFIEVRGALEGNISVWATMLSSAYEELCSFSCSDEDINMLQQNISRSGMSNFMDIPTDCPQRDERLGWTGDIAVFASTACFNFELSRFLEKWLTDLASEQSRGGAIPVVVPHVKLLQKLITAGWGDSCVLVPWASYLASGDVGIIERFYPVMKKYLKGVERMCAHSSSGKKKYIWSFGFSFGDWCAPDEKQVQWMKKKKWISTAYFAHTCGIAAQAAQLLGFEDDADYYTQLRENIIDAFREVFTDGKGKINKEFQTAYVCPLYFGMTRGEETAGYAANLARLVEAADNHLTTGFLGTPYLLFALSDNGYASKAYDVLLQDTCPSWLYEVKAGGTTVWERWDALRPDGTVNLGEGALENPETAFGGGMVSFNHYANGAVGDWLYRRMAGIEQLQAGYKSFKVQPVIDRRITHVCCEKITPYGTIKSEWHCRGGEFSLEVQVPFNTRAQIVLPDGENIQVGSGSHSFNTVL